LYILLPPSEGKAAGGTRRPRRLSVAALDPFRDQVLDALITLCADPTSAIAALGLSPGQADEAARNTLLRSAPTQAAGKVYTGVLYDALDLATLSADALKQAERSVLVFSGLWGVVRLTDRVPTYRCPITAKLPGLGLLQGYWRQVLDEPLTETIGGRLVLDLRSSGYATAWTPSGRGADRTAAVRVLHERVVDGVVTRSVVSHFNKATKGRLVRDLLTAGARPRSVPELVSALRDLKYTIEEQPRVSGKPHQLDVVVAAL
jgi:cytoplasmic iron level regulating protein YaaA (DUF328/UPF0246 family)